MVLSEAPELWRAVAPPRRKECPEIRVGSRPVHPKATRAIERKADEESSFPSGKMKRGADGDERSGWMRRNERKAVMACG